MIEVFSELHCPHGRKVCWVLGRLGLEFRFRDLAVGEHREAFVAIAGDELPPLLVDGEQLVVDGTSIAFDLERRYGEPSIFPEDSRRRNQAVTLDEFAVKALIPAITASIAATAEAGLLAERLQQARQAIQRGAIGRSDECHLGDIAVAAALVDAERVPDFDFSGRYADLVDYRERIGQQCRPVNEG